MDRETREFLRAEVDRRARERAEGHYMDVDPESITQRALEAEEQGYDEIAASLRSFRDKVVNPLLGMGLSLARIEDLLYRLWSK